MPRKKKPQSPNAKGRRKGEGQFWKLRYDLIKSDAFRSLQGNSVKVLIELRGRFNGANNGKLYLSYQEAADLLGMSKSSVKRAFEELLEKGLVRREKDGHWYGRQAAEYSTTFDARDGHLKTDDWRNWKKPLKQKNKKTVPKRNSNGADGAALVPKAERACRQSTGGDESDMSHGAAKVLPLVPYGVSE